MAARPPAVTVLYDHDCGFCRWSIGRLLAWDRAGHLRPLAIQSAEGQRLLADLTPEQRLATAHAVDAAGRRTSGGDAMAPIAAVLAGGGHGSFNDSAYDCSGSVSYVLHGAGLLGRPRDSSELMSWGQPGPGRWITVYANAGHTFMIINGKRYDTTGRWDTGSRWQRTDRSSAGYIVRHPAGL